MIAQIFNPTVEVAMPTGVSTNEANAEIETACGSRNQNKKVFKVI